MARCLLNVVKESQFHRRWKHSPGLRAFALRAVVYDLKKLYVQTPKDSAVQAQRSQVGNTKEMK